MTSARPLCLALAFAVLGGAAVAALAPMPAAWAKDDPVKIKEKRDAYRKNCKEKQKKYPYYDLSYGVAIEKIDSRWAQDEIKDASEEKGVMFQATFSLPASTDGSKIVAFNQKFLHKSLDGKSTFTVPLERAGKSPETASKNDMAEGFHLEYVKTYKEIDKDKTVGPKKVKVGPAELFSTITGMDPQSNAKERTDIYIWTSPNVTWVMKITYSGIMVKKADDFQEKVQELMKAHSELKGVPD